MSIKKYLDKTPDLTGKKVIVTGGTSGIGLALVKHLLYKNAIVVIMARNLKKAEEVRNNLLADYPDKTITIIKYDQSDDQSIKEACTTIINEHRDFYALVLNAGIFQSKKKMTYVDDIPLTIKTNYVGVKTILDILLPRLHEEHRLILQGSVVASWRNKKIDSLKTKKLSSFQQYIISKSGVEALFYHYSNLDNCPCSFYLVEPGLTNSEIIRDFPTPVKQMGHVFLKVASHSVNKAALTALYALDPYVEKNAFIVPRGLFSCMGYPKIRKFPKKRRRENLYNLLG